MTKKTPSSQRSNFAAWTVVALLVGFILLIPVFLTQGGTLDQFLKKITGGNKNLVEKIATLEYKVSSIEREVNYLNRTILDQRTPTPRTPTPINGDPTTQLATTELVVQVQRGNVRSGPGTNYSIIDEVREGQVIPGPFTKQYGWYRFCCVNDAQNGWLAGSLVIERPRTVLPTVAPITISPVPTLGTTPTVVATTTIRPTRLILPTPVPPGSRTATACMNLLSGGQYQKAADCYDEQIIRNPNAPTNFLNRGVAKARLGQHGAAAQDFSQAIRLEPTQACAFRNRGISRLKLGQIQAAYADFTQAITIRPNYDEAYTSRGLTLLQDFKDYQSAVADFDKAVSLQGRNSTSTRPRVCSPTPAPNPTPGPSPTPHFCPDLCYVDDDSRYIITYLGRGWAHFYLSNRQLSLSDAETALSLARRYGDTDSEASAINLINAHR